MFVTLSIYFVDKNLFNPSDSQVTNFFQIFQPFPTPNEKKATKRQIKKQLANRTDIENFCWSPGNVLTPILQSWKETNLFFQTFFARPTPFFSFPSYTPEIFQIFESFFEFLVWRFRIPKIKNMSSVERRRWQDMIIVQVRRLFDPHNSFRLHLNA